MAWDGVDRRAQPSSPPGPDTPPHPAEARYARSLEGVLRDATALNREARDLLEELLRLARARRL